jgi:hypothetical protein
MADTTTAPWHGRQVTWTVDGERLTAPYMPHELVMVKTALEHAGNRRGVEVIHELKARLDGMIVDAEATP